MSEAITVRIEPENLRVPLIRQTPTIRGLLTDALHDLRRCWPQLIAADLLAKAVALLLIVPIYGVLLRAFLAARGNTAVSDLAIVSFLLHPLGIAAVIVCGAVSLFILLAENSQLMAIGYACAEGRRLRPRRSLLYVYRRGPSILRMAWRAVLRLLLIALPFLAAIGVVYWALLGEFDISYYLAERPPAFWLAVGLAAPLAIGMGLLIVSQVAAWLLALPIVLFEGSRCPDALRASANATAPNRRTLILWLLGWIGAVLLLSTLVNTILSLVASELLPTAATNLRLLVIGLGALLLIGGLAQLLIATLSTVLFPLLVVRLYRAIAGPGTLSGELAAAPAEPATPGRVSGKAAVIGSLALLTLIAAGASVGLQSVDWHERCTIIAHRGGAAVAPENTLAACERAIADGANWLEIDVQEDADGVVRVIHDRDVMRVGRLGRDVADLAAGDWSGLDVGSYFAPGFADQRVPTLQEVLKLARGRIGVVIELKYYGRDQNLEAKVVELVEAAGVAAEIVVMSLEHNGVRKTAALRPKWTFGQLSAVSIGDLTSLNVNFVAVAARAATGSLIRRAHDRNMQVYTWTINDPVQMWKMTSRGVDGLITDRVALARQVLEMRSSATPLGRFVIWMAAEAGLLRADALSLDEQGAGP